MAKRRFQLAVAACAVLVSHDAVAPRSDPPLMELEPEREPERELAEVSSIAPALAEMVAPRLKPRSAPVPQRIGAAITGVVRDRIAGVVPGADVVALRNGVPIASVSCDGAGRFRLLAAPGPLELRVDAQGYAIRTLRTSAPNRVEILLSPESVVRGRVVAAPAGIPVPDVLVVVVSNDRRFQTSGWSESSGVTDENGEFEVGRVSPGLHRVEARSDAWVASASGPIAVPFAEDVEGVVVEVRPALSISGRVLSDRRDYCARGTLEVVEEERGIRRRVEFAADEDAALGGLIEGSYGIAVTCAEGAVTTYPSLALSAPMSGLEWHVASGHTVVGHVVDFAGDAVPAVQVTLSPGLQAMTDRAGRFRMVGLEGGTHSIAVFGAKQVEPSQIELPLEEPLEIIVDRPGSLRGRLLSRDLEPLSGFAVHVAGYETVSDPAGRFFFPYLPPGVHALSARHEEHSSKDESRARHSIAIDPGETTTATVVEMISVEELSGTAIDPDGYPLSGVIVSALRTQGVLVPDGEEPRSKPADVRPDRAISDSDGRFTLTGLPQGEYFVIGQGFGRGEARQRAWTGDHIRLEMQPVARLLGRAILAGGTRPKSIQVHLTSEHHEVVDFFYNEDGSFSFSDLPFGTYQLHVLARDAKHSGSVSVQEALVVLPQPITIPSPQHRLRQPPRVPASRPRR